MKIYLAYIIGFITPFLLVLTINTAERYHHKNGRPFWDDMTNKMEYSGLNTPTNLGERNDRN